MKKSIKLWIGGSLLLSIFSASCDPGCILYAYPGHLLSNQSGHTVSIVHKPSCIQLPDSLVLTDGESFVLNMPPYYGEKLDMSYELEPFETQAIYYDGRYKMDLKNLPEDRRLQNTDIYTYEKGMGKGDRKYVFILTPDDYAYAVEHGTDLGPLE